MKAKLVALLLILMLALVGVCVWQQGELRRTKARLAQAQNEIQAEIRARADQETKAAALERRQAGLDQQVSEFTGLVGNLRASEAKNGSNYVRLLKNTNATNDPAEGGLFGGKGMAGMYSKMMKDPAMKEMMRSSQKAAMNTMYGSLFKELNLSADQKEKLTGLLLDQQMQSMESAGVMFEKDGKPDLGKIGEAARDSQRQSDENIKTLLGDEKFAQYEEYKKTMGERMEMDQFKQQMEGTDSALKDDQLKQLMSMIKDEREKSPPGIADDPNESVANLEKLVSGDSMEKQMQGQEDFNRRVLERARLVLSADQLKAYADFQNQQLSMQKFGMKMAREMFGDKAGGPDAPPVK
jgi:uncharacterized protein YdbL (DUF1318 family)